MKLSTFATIITILAFGYGLAFLFIPVKLMAIYGIDLDNGGVIVARYFGGANLFLGMIFWSYSQVSPTAKSWPKLLRFNLAYDIIQLIVTLIPLLNGEANSMAWTIVALFILLATGSAYYLSQSSKAAA